MDQRNRKQGTISIVPTTASFISIFHISIFISSSGHSGRIVEPGGITAILCRIENAVTRISRFLLALHTSSARNGTEFRLLSHCQKLGRPLCGFSWMNLTSRAVRASSE